MSNNQMEDLLKNRGYKADVWDFETLDYFAGLEGYGFDFSRDIWL